MPLAREFGRGAGPWLALAGAVAITLSGCGNAVPSATDDVPAWKQSADTVAITAAPDAGGVLSFRNCPTLDEARAAIPAITTGPDANAVPYKSMVLQCSYGLPGVDVSGRPAGIGILVFDAVVEGRPTFTWTLEDDGARTAIPDIGDVAFAVDRSGQWDLFASAGRFGLHVSHTSRDDLGLEPLSGLARAMVIGLGHPPR